MLADLEMIHAVKLPLVQSTKCAVVFGSGFGCSGGFSNILVGKILRKGSPAEWELCGSWFPN